MSGAPACPGRTTCFALLLLLASATSALAGTSWRGILRDPAGHAIGQAAVLLQATSGGRNYSATTSANGEFLLPDIAPQSYAIAVRFHDKIWRALAPLVIKDGDTLIVDLALSANDQSLLVLAQQSDTSAQASGGGHLSSGQVSSLPLNERDFSKLLLLAAGTMTDSNGAANFTQQFTVNGMRGTASVFAIDGADTSDPELGRRYLLQLQCGRHPGSSIEFRSDASRNRPRRCRLHQRSHQVGHRSAPWKRIRICPQCRLRRKKFLRSQPASIDPRRLPAIHSQ